MGTQRQQVVDKVCRELGNSAQWQQTVGNQWICPYCGNLAKVPKKADLPTRAEAITDHLIDGCPGWQAFRGMTLPIKVMKGKRLAVLIDFKLNNDPAWKCFDEGGHWHCPYSLQRVTMPSKDPREIREAIKEHLKHNHAFNHGKGKTHPEKKMRQAVDRANSIDRLSPRVREVLLSDPRWQERALDGSWVCPFCQERVKNIDISTEILRRETAPRTIAEHMMLYCRVFQKVQVRGKEGDLRPPENLVRITNFIVERRDRKERETASKLEGKKKQGRKATREIRFEDLPPVQKEPAPDHDASRDEVTRKRTKKELQPRAEGGGFSVDKVNRLDESRIGLDESGVGISAEGFEMSFNVQEDEATTWDAINDPRAPRVNSAQEGGRITNVSITDNSTAEVPAVSGTPVAGPPAAHTPLPVTGGVAKPIDEPMPVVEAAAALARPAAGHGASTSDEAAIDEKTRIVQMALSRARRSLMEMIGPIPRAQGYEFGAVFRPSPGLDGDFFHYFDLGSGRYALACWEVSESGMDMVPINRHFLELLRKRVAVATEPREALVALNQEIFESTAPEVYFSVSLAFVDTTTHQLTLCNAGFQPLMLFNQFRKPPLEEVNTNGIVLGSDEGSLFATLLEQRQLELRPQDLVVCHSEGVGGFDDIEGNPMSLERFKGLVESHGRQDASFFLSMTDAEYKRLRGGGPTPRDLTILAIKRL